MKAMTNKQRCRNCLHRCVCLHQEYFENVVYLGERCKHYKAKKEQTRCKDCEWYVESEHTESGHYCSMYSGAYELTEMQPEDFCSYAKKRRKKA